MNLKSSELEQYFLAGILKFPHVFHEISNFISEDDFVSNQTTKIVFQVIRKIIESGENVDPILVAERINSLNISFREENMSPFDYLNGLSMKKVTEKGLTQCAKDLKKTTIGRKIYKKAAEVQKFLKECDSSEDVNKIISSVDKIYNEDLMQMSNFSDTAINIFEDLEAVVEERGENPIEEFGLSGPYQRINDLYGSLFRAGDISVVVARAKAGKALKLSQKILTPSGWKTHGSIKVGDQALSPDGSIANVIGYFPHPNKEIYRFHFEDGRYTDCCEDHLWKFYGRDNKGIYKWMVDSTLSIMNNHLTHVSKTVYTPTKQLFKNEDIKLPLDPYILGAIIGDGCITEHGVSICSGDDFIYQKIKNIVDGWSIENCKCSDKKDIRGHCFSFSFFSKSGKGKKMKSSVLDALIDLGLHCKKSYEKFIPEEYFSASDSQKISLLQGLCDTDGYINSKGGMEYSTTSERLAFDFQRLIWELGGVCKKSERYTWYTYNGEKKRGRKSYRLVFRLSDRSKVFTLPRKLERASLSYKYDTYKIKVKSIEKLPDREDCACISLDSKDGLYITDDYIVTHNTSISLDLCTKTAAMHKIPVLHLDNGEMSLENLQMRQCSAMSGVPMHYLETGKWRQNEEMVKKVRSVWPHIKGMQYDYFNVGGFSEEEMLNFVRRYYYGKVGRGNEMILVFDYLKFRSQDAKGGDSWYVMGHMLDQFKQLIQKEILHENKPKISMFTSVQANRSGIARDGRPNDDEGVVSLSDMIGQLCSHLFLLRKKTLQEISEEGGKWGTHKFIPLLNRHLGRMAIRAINFVDLPSGEKVNNYVSLDLDNFKIEEKGDVHDWLEFISTENQSPVCDYSEEVL